MVYYLSEGFKALWFTTLVKDSRHTWSLFGGNKGGTTILGSQEAANVCFSRI